jgi:hypothetical protein
MSLFELNMRHYRICNLTFRRNYVQFDVKNIMDADFGTHITSLDKVSH